MRDGIDPGELEVCLRVIAELDGLPVEHPDAIAVQRATSSLYKTVKLRRKLERREAILSADRAVTDSDRDRRPGPDRRRDPRPAAASARRRAATAGTLLAAARLLRLQGALHAGRRLLPPALSRLRGARTTASGTPAPT